MMPASVIVVTTTGMNAGHAPSRVPAKGRMVTVQPATTPATRSRNGTPPLSARRVFPLVKRSE